MHWRQKTTQMLHDVYASENKFKERFSFAVIYVRNQNVSVFSSKVSKFLGQAGDMKTVCFKLHFFLN